MTDKLSDALVVFPEELKRPLMKACTYFSDVYEIRLITDTSVFAVTPLGVRFVGKNGEILTAASEKMLIPTEMQLEEITDRAIGFSGFSHEQELKNGFITYSGACRMGICTSGDGEFFGRGKISSLSVRLPFAKKMFYPKSIDTVLCDAYDGILVAGPPSSGKTTLLRYIARRLSDGVLGEYKKVCVIDERYELSDGYHLGLCTDVISGKEKARSLLHAIRLMSPEFVVCDEIGSIDETNALLQGLNSGVSFVASMHANSISSLMRRKQFNILFRENVFGKVIFLSRSFPGCIENVYDGSELYRENFGEPYTLSVT